MEYNKNKVDEHTLALLYLVMCERKEGHGGRAWKSFDWDSMDRLYEKGYISEPKGTAKSVRLSEDGCKRAEMLFWDLFGKQGT